MQSHFSINELFSPLSFSTFLRQYREKRPLHLEAPRGDRFQSLLSREVLDYLIGSGFLRFPDCKLAKNGRDVPQNTYMAGDFTGGVIDADALYAGYRAGATIVMNSLHRYWQPLTDFCLGLERRLSVPVQANAYITPPSSQGFGIHYDPHDVLVLQISGCKHWRLYHGPVVLPSELQPYDRATVVIEKLRSRHTLRPGDLIYLPRGQLHEAFTRSEASVHVTVGLISVTWSDVLREAVQQWVESDLNLRRSLPPGYADHANASASIQRELAQLRRRMARRLPLSSAFNQVADRFVSRRLAHPHGYFVGLPTAAALTGETVLRRRRDVRFRTWRANKTVHLLFFRKKMSFPGFVAPTLRHVCRSKDSFQPRELPGPLTAESKIVLCRSLLAEGFLQTEAVTSRATVTTVLHHES